MKTAEQVADDAMKAFTITYEEDVEEQSAEFIREQIVAAIEADREQRSARLEDLFAFDHYKVDEEEGREERILVVDIDTSEGMGRMRVYINDHRIYDGDPETGQEWSLT